MEKMAGLLIILPAIIAIIDTYDHYCMPSNGTCWPSKLQWDELKRKITGEKLHDISDERQYDKVCNASGRKAAYILEDEGQGRCMQYQDCSQKTCKKGSGWNVPEYSVEVSHENDIIEAINFANKHNIQVVVKTSGHSFAGSSMGNGALLIWMRNYQKFGDIKKSYNKCGTTYDAVLKVGGGEVWAEAYKAVSVGNEYHVVGGGALTVSAAGGWLNGGGLSSSARLYGMGVDQVVDFEVVLADGTKATASKCENEDLFWALRGGGGGSFGVTTSVHYKLHASKPFCEFSFTVSDFYEPTWDKTTVYKWIDLLVDSAPSLGNRWGGDWGFNLGIFYYEGTKAEILEDNFYKSIIALGNIAPSLNCDQSYIAARFRPDEQQTEKIETGQDEFNIASRLIPKEFVEKNPDHMKQIFKWMVNNGFDTLNYILGGKMMDVAADATAVHPGMRQAVFQMETYDNRLIQKLREEFPGSGVSLNHGAKDEPDWANQFWGSNRERVEMLKKKYDPSNRFNCWHCVGYVSPISSTSF